jgi:nitrite reductase/ring-hydroxylating ferredoxin subunit
VATGMADWSDSYGAERTVGLYHGALNLLALVLYIVSAVLRLGVSTGESIPAAILGFVAIIAVIVAAYLGGDMVFGKGTGVNHTAWEQAGEGYEAVQPVDDMPANALRRVTVAGVAVVLLKLGEKYYAIAATCSHAGGPLDEGELQGDIVQCPWHGSRFKMRDGKPVTGPATFHQPRYDVRIRNGMIELKRA